ncbi:FK506-binding protein-like [Pelomyxa schiedti]|nr:FK506-binding protein-like [Pelomyxa schiedti]
MDAERRLQDWLRDPAAREAAAKQVESEDRRKARDTRKRVSEAVASCDAETRDLVQPLLKLPYVAEILRPMLDDDTHSDPRPFAEKMRDPVVRALMTKLNTSARETIRQDGNPERFLESWKRTCGSWAEGEAVRREQAGQSHMVLDYAKCAVIMSMISAQKSDGNAAFKSGDYAAALRHYSDAAQTLCRAKGETPAEDQVISAERLAILKNVAITNLKLGDPRACAQACDAVLKESPGDVKALYRRGIARTSLGEFDGARCDFNAVLSVENNAEARRALADVDVAEKALQDRELNIYRKMVKKPASESTAATTTTTSTSSSTTTTSTKE